MNVDRLNKLADFLDTVPAQNFDMGSWVGNGMWETLSPRFEQCGTTACAMGWAATMPEFNLEGLHWVESHHWSSTMEFNGKTSRPELIGAQFFDIPEDDATKLFKSSLFKSSRRNSREQAQFIRKYIASKPECVELFYAASADTEHAGSDRPIELHDNERAS